MQRYRVSSLALLRSVLVRYEFFTVPPRQDKTLNAGRVRLDRRRPHGRREDKSSVRTQLRKSRDHMLILIKWSNLKRFWSGFNMIYYGFPKLHQLHRRSRVLREMLLSDESVVGDPFRLFMWESFYHRWNTKTEDWLSFCVFNKYTGRDLCYTYSNKVNNNK